MLQNYYGQNYYEHSRFAFLQHLLQTICDAKGSILVSRKDRVSITIKSIDVSDSGCGCGISYKSICIAGVGNKKRTKSDRDKWCTTYICHIGQYDNHICIDKEPHICNDFLFKFDFEQRWCAYHIYIQWNELVRTYMLTKNALQKKMN